MIAELNTAALARRFHDERERRGVSLETVALQMGKSIRTVAKLDELGRGFPSAWQPSGATLGAIIEWLDHEPSVAETYDASTIERIVDLVRESNLDIMTCESVVSAIRGVWSVAQSRRPLGGSTDARALLAALVRWDAPMLPVHAREKTGMTEGDRFTVAVASLIASGLIAPNTMLLSLTQSGRDAARSLGVTNEEGGTDD